MDQQVISNFKKLYTKGFELAPEPPIVNEIVPREQLPSSPIKESLSRGKVTRPTLKNIYLTKQWKSDQQICLIRMWFCISEISSNVHEYVRFDAYDWA